MKVCPKDLSHKEFITVAHEQHDWRVDGHGNFIADLGCISTAHGPNPDNEWTCAVCGAPAVEG
jgi:hypothetical protein